MSQVSVATTVKSSLATIRHYLDYHLRAGVHRIYLFLDDCEAGLLEEIRRNYAGRVEVQDCDARYWQAVHSRSRPESVEERQRLNADHALALALASGDTWIAHVDVDEYIHTDAGNLPAVLDLVPADCNVVRMDVLEAIPTSVGHQSVSGIRYFKSLPFGIPSGDRSHGIYARLRRSFMLFTYKVTLILAKALGMSFARAGFHDFYNAHSMGKSITRVSADVKSLRLHVPWFKEGVEVRSYSTPRCRLLHFESWSFAEWKGKWQRRSSIEGFAAALDRRQKSIFDAFRACGTDAQRLADLYRKLYFYSPRELRTLGLLGLVKIVDLPEGAPPEGFACRVTGYAGVEAQIVALRNANRQSSQSMDYMNWRYQAAGTTDAPEIFWLDDATQSAIGMAALIPRRYWIDGVAESMALLGDISVNAAHRGKGLGQLLLGFMTRSADERHPARRNLVIPTDAARKALRSLGWRAGGTLSRHVLIVDPAPLLERKLGSSVAAGAIASVYRRISRMMFGIGSADARLLEFGSDFDERFDSLWQRFDKAGLCLCDRSAATLRWRYGSHPTRRFENARLMAGNAMCAYVVFETEAGTCTIYDVLGESSEHVSRLLAAFITSRFDSVTQMQVTLSDDHPFLAAFRAKGFVRRDSVEFQLHEPPGRAAQTGLRWALTHGDKDI